VKERTNASNGEVLRHAVLTADQKEFCHDTSVARQPRTDTADDEIREVPAHTASRRSTRSSARPAQALVRPCG
jgi:hypothetical protein